MSSTKKKLCNVSTLPYIRGTSIFIRKAQAANINEKHILSSRHHIYSKSISEDRSFFSKVLHLSMTSNPPSSIAILYGWPSFSIGIRPLFLFSNYHICKAGPLGRYWVLQEPSNLSKEHESSLPLLCY